MDAWSDQPEARAVRVAADKTLAEALVVPTASECPGRAGLCGRPLAGREPLCPGCAGTQPDVRGGSAALQRQIGPPSAPECAGCRRPVSGLGEVCRWCRGQRPAGPSPSLRSRIDARAVKECPGDGGLCGAPLRGGEVRCARCLEERGPAPAAAWERCGGRDGACRRQVLPGRGQCLECRQAAGVSRVVTFSAEGARAY